MNNRSSGILLHPTSLPGGHCIGDLGTAVYQFVDLLDCLSIPELIKTTRHLAGFAN